jgi:hypothetical protein
VEKFSCLLRRERPRKPRRRKGRKSMGDSHTYLIDIDCDSGEVFVNGQECKGAIVAYTVEAKDENGEPINRHIFQTEGSQYSLSYLANLIQADLLYYLAKATKEED